MRKIEYVRPEAFLVTYPGRLMEGEFTGYDPVVDSKVDPNTAKQNLFFYADTEVAGNEESDMGFYRYSPWDD